jgi:hypothetical protein
MVVVVGLVEHIEADRENVDVGVIGSFQVKPARSRCVCSKLGRAMTIVVWLLARVMHAAACNAVHSVEQRAAKWIIALTAGCRRGSALHARAACRDTGRRP